MDQTVYNTSRGRILELTDPNGSATIKRMAIHNDVLLAALAPLYWIHAGPETLLISQTVVLALGALFLYLIARNLTQSRLLSLTLSFAYLMYPALQWSNTYDFHVVTFATTLLLAMFYFLLTKRYGLSLLCLILALLAKEQIGMVTGLLGIYLAVKGERKIGITFFIVSISWFLLSVWYIIPHFRTTQHFAISRYAQFGKSPTGVISGMLSRPLDVLQLVVNKNSLDYIVALFGPLLFVCLLSPLVLILAPELAVNLLSNNSNMQSIIFQYTAVMTPVLFVASIHGYLYMHKRLGMTYKNIAIVQLIVTLLFSYYMSPLPYSKKYDRRITNEIKTEIRDINEWARKLKNEQIPVSASLGVATKFTDRKVMIPFSSHYSKADYVILLKQEVLNDWFNADGSRRAFEELVADERFERVYAKDDLEVYKKVL